MRSGMFTARLAGLARPAIAATLAAALTGLTGALALVTAFADPPSSTSSTARAAAGWLARQLVDGERFESDFGGTAFPDQGLTADAVLALDAANTAQDSAAKATAWLARTDVLTGYLGDGTAESYTGPHAKLALVAEAQGTDPTSFGGVDLISALQALQAPSGRFVDRSAFGDFSNGITQALAVIALQRHGGAPQPAVDYLAATRCPDGGFPLFLEQASCASDVDTTGFVVQALLAAGRGGPAGTALDWLATVQKPDGGFGGGGPTAGENANSTGLAAEALAAGGRAAPAGRAVTYLTSLAVDCSGTAADRGAIAYDTSGFDPANAVRATAQAVPGIAGVSLAEVTAQGAGGEAATLDCGGTSPSPSPTAPAGAGGRTGTAAPSSPGGSAERVPATDATGRTLAATGVGVVPLLGIGALAVLAGVAVLLAARRTTVEEQR